MKKIVSLLFAALFALVTLAGCGSSHSSQPASENTPLGGAPSSADKLNVVTTIFPQYDFVREIAGDNVNLTMLLPPGAESHSFEPSPQDIITIQNCDVFIYVGGDSDEWIRGILDSMDTSGMTVLSLMDMVEVKQEEIVEGMEHTHDHAHSHDEIDPDNVKDRPLTDWDGEWATIEPALEGGALDEYVAAQAAANEVPFDEQYAQYEAAWKTEYPTLHIEGDDVCFRTPGGEMVATYTYGGFELAEGDHGLSVWYGYTKAGGDEGAPATLVFSDHSDGNHSEEEDHDAHDAAHTHLRYGRESVAQLAAKTDWTPFYFNAAATHEEIATVLSGHSHPEEEEGHDHEEDAHDHGEEEHEHEAELDEHVWTSPKNAKQIVQSLSGTLSGLDKAHADVYAQNAAAYLQKLDELDAAFEGVVAQAKRHTLVFGDRFPFRYFADAYGLSYYAAFPGCSTETEPSAATIAFLIDKVQDEDIPVVFHIEMSNQKMADTICGDTGAKKRLMHSCHNVTQEEMDAGASYLSLMTQNIEVVKEALE